MIAHINYRHGAMSVRTMVPAGYVLGCGLALALLLPLERARASDTEQVLYNFCGQQSCIDGSLPLGGLLKVGNSFYGTTFFGGAGYGTVFKITTRGVESLVYTFSGGNDGANPAASLIRDKSGNIYGTTSNGGENNKGTVFRLAPNGTESVLYSFGVSSNDGAYPKCTLYIDKSGNLYGTTNQGGASNYGTIFKVAPNGTEWLLSSFSGGSDGAYPAGGLARGKGENLYGTTSQGGANGYGTVFEWPTFGGEIVVHSFDYTTSDGANPDAGLVADGKGNLYGTTVIAGAYGYGTVFEISPGGSESVLYSFQGSSDGSYPEGSLIMDDGGNLYGTTNEGGNADCSSGCGTVFELTPDGAKTLLYAFSGSDGANPGAELLSDKHGHLYGTTMQGGPHGDGVAFVLTPP